MTEKIRTGEVYESNNGNGEAYISEIWNDDDIVFYVIQYETNISTATRKDFLEEYTIKCVK